MENNKLVDKKDWDIKEWINKDDHHYNDSEKLIRL